MRLYLDDDSVDSALIRLLTAAGHDILIPAVAGTACQEDAIHLMRSIQTNRSLMTRNYDDFKLLHDLVLFSGGHHAGILVVRRDNDPSRDMSNRAIVQAVTKVSSSGTTFSDSFHILNHWR
jgi:Domain of unknown function (DUF5615)